MELVPKNGGLLQGKGDEAHRVLRPRNIAEPASGLQQDGHRAGVVVRTGDPVILS